MADIPFVVSSPISFSKPNADLGYLDIEPRFSSQSKVAKAAFFGDIGLGGETLEQVYGPTRFQKIRQMTDLYPAIVTSQNIQTCLPELQDLEVIFATWGMIPLTDEQLDQLPSLQAVFYAAGTIRPFGMPLLRRGIIVTSSAPANAVPVAEFTLAQILLANKGYYRNLREYRDTCDYSRSFVGIGNHGATVSLLGAGQIGRKLIELLQPFSLKVAVFDPYLSIEEAACLGVEKVNLSTAFARGDVVSNHLADIPATVGMIDGNLLSSMHENATFINTGRGRTVCPESLIACLRARADLIALLDVTDPEPLTAESPLWNLPNAFITSHIAGSKNREIERMADFAIADFERWSRGEPLRYAVTLDGLERMA